MLGKQPTAAKVSRPAVRASQGWRLLSIPPLGAAAALAFHVGRVVPLGSVILLGLFAAAALLAPPHITRRTVFAVSRFLSMPIGKRLVGIAGWLLDLR
jgi:hypothetical protein